MQITIHVEQRHIDQAIHEPFSDGNPSDAFRLAIQEAIHARFEVDLVEYPWYEDPWTTHRDTVRIQPKGTIWTSEAIWGSIPNEMGGIQRTWVDIYCLSRTDRPADEPPEPVEFVLTLPDAMSELQIQAIHAS